MAVGILQTTDLFPCVTQAYRPITLIGAYRLISFITHRTPGHFECVCVFVAVYYQSIDIKSLLIINTIRRLPMLFNIYTTWHLYTLLSPFWHKHTNAWARLFYSHCAYPTVSPVFTISRCSVNGRWRREEVWPFPWWHVTQRRKIHPYICLPVTRLSIRLFICF